MHARGFTDHELDIMFKNNPARLLGLSPSTAGYF
jgi:predicted metal-dependent phosphotriesterase family hydrolase